MKNYINPDLPYSVKYWVDKNGDKYGPFSPQQHDSIIDYRIYTNFGFEPKEGGIVTDIKLGKHLNYFEKKNLIILEQEKD